MSKLKARTANSLKWNLVDKISTQLLYAITGIILARELNEEDFGLVGALLIFQAFASLIIDSGFSYALLQRKRPSRLDYSSVLWFNLGTAVLFYIILWFCAPFIAGFFQNDFRLVPLARLQFLVLITNASAIVQVNRLMKAMDVRMVAASNSLGLFAGGIAGIWLAIEGFGPWAIVWQSLIVSACKALVLWTSTRWRPLARFSVASIRSFMGIGLRMMFTSILNTIFLKIYSFLIGWRVGLGSLGYYTQADKWSTMGVSSIGQSLTSSFLPALSTVQNDFERFNNMASKMNRFTSYLVFPGLIGLMVVATPLFHGLFGDKWDPSIVLFQLLLLRGIFVVFNTLYTNILLALGEAKKILRLEVLRDVLAVAGLVVTFPFIGLRNDGNSVEGLEILLWGQLVATVLTWCATLWCVIRSSKGKLVVYIRDMAPYFCLTAVCVPLMGWAGALVPEAWFKLALELSVALAVYLGVNYVLGSKIQKDIFIYLRCGKLSL